MSDHRASGMLEAIDWLVEVCLLRLLALDDLLSAMPGPDLSRVLGHLDAHVIGPWADPAAVAGHLGRPCPLGLAADSAENLAADALSMLDLIRFTGYQWATDSAPTPDVIDRLRAQIAAAEEVFRTEEALAD